jgi:DNA-directed RNA polymerase specialized sigma24 family protein
VLLADPEPHVDPEPPGEGSAGEGWADALDRLAAGERLVVELRYRHDQTHQAIAGQLGMPVGTVKARLHRARRRLEEALAHQDA